MYNQRSVYIKNRDNSTKKKKIDDQHDHAIVK